MTLTGWEKRVGAHPDAAHLSPNQCKRLAHKIAKRAANMQFTDPDDLIRSVICYSDPTGETAVRNLTKEAA